MAGSSWIFFYLDDGQLQSGASRKFLSWGSRMFCGMSWVQDKERPPGSALCCGGTFVLKGGRRGDDAWSPRQQQCRDAEDSAVSCRGAGELLEVSCPHPRLNSNISGAVGYLGVALLNQDLKTGIFPKFKRYFKFLNPRKRNRSSGAEASGTTCHSHFASPWI